MRKQESAIYFNYLNGDIQIFGPVLESLFYNNLM